MSKKIDIAQTILSHPDKEEIIAKLSIGSSCADISEWLECKYSEVAEKQFVLSEKTLKTFKDDYFDFYQIIKSDINQLTEKTPSNELNATLANNLTYMNALESFANTEIDIRTIIKRMVQNIEARASQVFDILQEDPRNFRNDKIMQDWFNTLLSTCEKFEPIINGTTGSQTNIQNNINITVVDKHISIISGLITDILNDLDVETSNLFMDRFSSAMQKLKSEDTMPLPIDVRLNEAKTLEIAVIKQLDNK